MTVAIQFDFNSARIRPSSFQAIGLIADALSSPYLQGYCFLIIGSTDAVRTREYNFKLSQQHTDAIRDALIDPLAIKPGRIEAVGLGEEDCSIPLILKLQGPAHAVDQYRKAWCKCSMS